MSREGGDSLVISALIFTLVSQCSWPSFTFGITDNLAENANVLPLNVSIGVTRAMDTVLALAGKLPSA